MKKRFLISFIISLLIFTGLYAFAFDKYVEPILAARKEKQKVLENREDYKFLEEHDSKDDKEKEQKIRMPERTIFLLTAIDGKKKGVKNTRTDTMMLINADYKNNKVRMLSIPRDTRVKYKGSYIKLNEVYYYGGIDGTVEVISELTGINLKYYVNMNYQAVTDIIDAIGGVEIDVPFRMKYKDPTADPPLDIDIEPGLQVLDGKQSHDYLRFRNDNYYRVGYREGDLGRVKAQQNFMKEMIKQVTSSKRLVLKLPNIVMSYYENVDTNIPEDLSLKACGYFYDLDFDSLENYIAPGEAKTIDDISFYILYPKQLEETVENFLATDRATENTKDEEN
ncbi:MAG: LCP family protein [Tissierellia bacterium]|nr:LCP family protein [Tissierellia bacterium]